MRKEKNEAAKNCTRTTARLFNVNIFKDLCRNNCESLMIRVCVWIYIIIIEIEFLDDVTQSNELIIQKDN